MMNYNRGTVWWVELPLNLHSHVQGGARPCVIVSNPLDRSGVVTVCPLSTKIDSIKTHPKVRMKKDGQVLVEQITTIDISSIGNYVGTLNDHDMNEVENALRVHLLGTCTAKSETSSSDTPNRFGLKLFNIERDLKKIIAMLDYIMWKEKNDR